MDEEVRLGKEEDLKRNHDITNGSSERQKIKIPYSFWGECKQIVSLVRRHSFPYIVKFLFLVIIVVSVSCITADSYHTLIVSSFTLLGSLVFDQIGKKDISDNFDFKRAEMFCDTMTLVIFILFLLSLLLLAVEDYIFDPDQTKNFIDLFCFRLIMFIVLAFSALSALVEAIVNIPEETLPSRQQKVGDVKSRTCVDISGEN